MATITIGYSAHLPSPSPERLGKLDTLVQYSVDGGPPDNVVIPDPDPSAELVQQAIRDQIAAKRKITGTTFTVD
jgi:flagellar biosynthesis/type III secretory pathway M-ring protein FliF/YscJ